MEAARHVRGAAVLLVLATLSLLITPVADTTPATAWDTPEARRAYLDEVGPIGAVPIAAAFVNRSGRKALASSLWFLERPFAAHQRYGMYAAFEIEPRWFEVWIDDRLVYRSQSPEHRWRAAVFANPRVAYPLDVRSPREKLAARGLGRWLVARAREDFAGLTRVQLRWLSGPTLEQTEAVHALTARAPHWQLEGP